MNLRARYESAMTFEEFLAGATTNVDFWRAQYRLARVDGEAIRRLDALPAVRHLLVLAEDWCGDAINSVPLLVRLAEASAKLDLRILGRDDNPDLMDAHLTGRSRSIPVVMVLDENFEEIGWWGPRPRELQEWVLSTGLAMEHKARYKEMRGWYARDAGKATLAEVLALAEGTAAADAVVPAKASAVTPANAGVEGSPS